MSSYMDNWSYAAGILGVTITSPYCVRVGATEIYPELLVPHFGSEKGTFIFTEMQSESILKELFSDGYTCSIFAPAVTGEEASVEDLKEVLTDWGWRGPPNQKPHWLED